MLLVVECVEKIGAEFQGCGYVEQIDGANADRRRERLSKSLGAGEGAVG